MSIRMDGIRTGAIRWWTIRLLLALFVVRALIPIGYMPDFGAAGHGVFKVVICSASGSKMLTLDADGKAIPDQKSGHHEQPCAFTGLISVAQPLLDTSPFIAPDFNIAAAISPLAVQLPPSRAGPQLGSRGPPQIS